MQCIQYFTFLKDQPYKWIPQPIKKNLNSEIPGKLKYASVQKKHYTDGTENRGFP